MWAWRKPPSTWSTPIVLAIALVVVAPVAEEIFFRGIVYNAWLREFGVWRAIIGSAALFALIHGSIFVIPAIFGLGIALALLYRRTGSLPASMAMHATFNGITLAHRPAGPLRRHPPALISAR